MLILKFHYTDEIDEIKISQSLKTLKSYIKDKFEDIHKVIEYKEIGQFIFVYGDKDEIGVIGEIYEI